MVFLGYFVAPGEADGQLAALARWGLLDGIVSMDGDLVIHGGSKNLY